VTKGKASVRNHWFPTN